MRAQSRSSVEAGNPPKSGRRFQTFGGKYACGNLDGGCFRFPSREAAAAILCSMFVPQLGLVTAPRDVE